jgi:hypothetical protein
MKPICWKTVAAISLLSMIVGFILACYGVKTDNDLFAYVGLVSIIVTCISWWVWVMLIIRTMWARTESALSLVGEIKQGIKEVRQLIREYKNLVDR